MLDKVQKLKDEANMIKETNCDLIRLITGMKSYSGVAASKMAECNNSDGLIKPITIMA